MSENCKKSDSSTDDDSMGHSWTRRCFSRSISCKPLSISWHPILAILRHRIGPSHPLKEYAYKTWLWLQPSDDEDSWDDAHHHHLQQQQATAAAAAAAAGKLHHLQICCFIYACWILNLLSWALKHKIKAPNWQTELNFAILQGNYESSNLFQNYKTHWSLIGKGLHGEICPGRRPQGKFYTKNEKQPTFQVYR